jgi:G3E family GTPase
LRGDLIDALEDLLRRLDNGRIAQFDRLVIETTGLADPAPVLHTIMSHPYLLLRFRLDGVVTVVDAVNGEATLAAHPEAVRQAAVSDRLVLSKCDLISSTEAGKSLARLRERLSILNPTARLIDRPESLDAKSLLDAGLYNPATKSPDVARWLNAEALPDAHHDHGHGHHGDDVNRHGESIRAFCLTSETPMPPSACDLFLEILRNAHGPRLLRVKGIIALADDLERPLIVHGVQHIFHPPVRLDAWPDASRKTRIVFIVQDLSPNFIQGLYDAFAGKPSIDRPDAQAIADNPLRPSPGGLLA